MGLWMTYAAHTMVPGLTISWRMLANSVPAGKMVAVGWQGDRSSTADPNMSWPSGVDPQNIGCTPAASRAASTRCITVRPRLQGYESNG